MSNVECKFDEIGSSCECDRCMAIKEQVRAEMEKDAESTSSKIEQLARQGYGPGEIAKALGIRYQHAYNVSKQKGVLNVKDQQDGLSVSAFVKGLAQENPKMSVGAISRRATKVFGKEIRYQWVYNVLKGASLMTDERKIVRDEE